MLAVCRADIIVGRFAAIIIPALVVHFSTAIVTVHDARQRVRLAVNSADMTFRGGADSVGCRPCFRVDERLVRVLEDDPILAGFFDILFAFEVGLFAFEIRRVSRLLSTLFSTFSSKLIVRV